VGKLRDHWVHCSILVEPHQRPGEELPWWNEATKHILTKVIMEHAGWGGWCDSMHGDGARGVGCFYGVMGWLVGGLWTINE